MTAEKHPALPPDFGSDTRFDSALRRSLAEESACRGISTEALEAGTMRQALEQAELALSAAQPFCGPAFYGKARQARHLVDEALTACRLILKQSRPKAVRQ